MAHVLKNWEEAALQIKDASDVQKQVNKLIEKRNNLISPLSDFVRRRAMCFPACIARRCASWVTLALRWMGRRSKRRRKRNRRRNRTSREVMRAAGTG